MLLRFSVLFKALPRDEITVLLAVVELGCQALTLLSW